MKRFLVVGLGHFGSWAARALSAQGYEVIAVERQEAVVDRHGMTLARAVVGDARDRELLREIGADTADVAVISTGDDLASAILVTLAVKDVGVEEIYVKVVSEDAARVLEALEVTEAIFPEREAAYRLAHRIPTHTVLQYIPLTDGYSIQEIAIPDRWLGKSLRDLELPRRHGVQIVAIYDVLSDSLNVVPQADDRLKESDVAVVAGPDAKIKALLDEEG